MTALLLPIIMPLAAGVVLLMTPDRFRRIAANLAVLVSFAEIAVAAMLFDKNATFAMPWFGYGFEIRLRIYAFSAFILLAVAFFGLAVALYSLSFMRDKRNAKNFYALLLMTVALASGVALSDNFILLLLFWEALLITLFGMIVVAGMAAFRTAVKMFIIIGLSDLCLMAGVAITGRLAGTYTISAISIPIEGAGALAFLLIAIGAMAKAGSMPFHSWIPDASIDAPLPFMALAPAAFEKLLGIYLLARVSLDLFRLQPGSWASYALMTVGAITILLGVMMALVQKNYKCLLSYHAISQVGYMILGIGTALPVGVIGGLFHMINNAIYKSCLFLTGGSVERSTGTTNLTELGGLRRRMPITFASFAISALAISGVWPFNGFFSKELIYDAALERGIIFYAAAAAGSFLTAASFLKLGHAAFFGPAGEKTRAAREAPPTMILPMIVLAAISIAFGVFSAWPINRLIIPSVSASLQESRHFALNPALVSVTIAILVCAVLNHLYGVRRTGKGLGAVDHIHHAPGLRKIYELAEEGYFDPYNIGLWITDRFAGLMAALDSGVDWIYDRFSPAASTRIVHAVKKLHDGNHRTYLAWALAGAVMLVVFLLKGV